MSNQLSKDKNQKHTKRHKAPKSEANASDLIFGLHAIQAALEVPVTRVKEIWLADDREDARIVALTEAAKRHGITPQKLAKDELDEMMPNVRHQGSVARCTPLGNLDETDLFKLLDDLDERSEMPFLLILDCVQDPHNLGACMRTAEAAGAHAVIAPKDRASGLTATALKVSSGAGERLPFIQVTNLARVLRELQQQGVWLVGTSGDSEMTLFDVDLKGPLAIVLGAEGRGIRRLTRENCDQIIYIPMRGEAESLNVSVAAGVCLFEAARQRGL
ncbi:MAG: 23S rRNA (guanosine(2251)-2'-O)-methyltransferase RlmB [Gammaproteobacteria bacterium]|nr:MAG: 23S rRNA (guanosine(2251)-2'-O)-methyltransferase RlmB [Gammaproteobacteria bacterium]